MGGREREKVEGQGREGRGLAGKGPASVSQRQGSEARETGGWWRAVDRETFDLLSLETFTRTLLPEMWQRF